MCGASVEVDVVVVGDEPPETDSTPSAGSRLGARLGVAAALAVVVGLAALVVFGGGSGDDGDEGAGPEATVTPAEPSPRPAPSPTAASDTEEKALAPIVQVGDPLEWRGGVELGPGRRRLAGVLGNGVIEESVTPSLIALVVVSVFVVGWGVVRHSFQRGVGIALLVAYAVIVALGA